ncbi:MAG: hypothetical protein KKF88_11585 [Alphaproteobacteria bacterium]|nr:hypothetical protein [Alphaproteobacteria bacterium]
MIRTFAAVVSIPALLLAASCAPGPDTAMNAQSSDTCFTSDRVINFRAGATPSVYVKAIGGDVFELQTFGPCRDIDAAYSIGLAPLAGESYRTCVGDGIDLQVAAGGVAANRCRARVVKKLSEEEVAALPSRYRP